MKCLFRKQTSYLRWRILCAVRLNPSIAIRVLDNLVWDLFDVTLNLSVLVFPADETFRCEESVFRVYDGLTLRGYANQTFTFLRKSNYGRRCSRT